MTQVAYYALVAIRYNLFCKKFISNNMELSDEMLAEINYVEISKYRTKVMKSLDGEVLIPSQIAKNSELEQIIFQKYCLN